MRCDIILSPNVRILRSYEVINSYLKTYPLHLCHTLFLWLKVSREGNWALSTRYAEHMESEYDNTNDVMHMPKESYSVQPASFTLTTGNSSNEYVINDDPVQITIENPDDSSNPLQPTEESHDMVSEVKSDENPKPSLHELTPGDNPVSKPPQLGTETSVIGKSKEPITNHTKDAPSIQGGTINAWNLLLRLDYHTNPRLVLPLRRSQNCQEQIISVSTLLKKQSQKIGILLTTQKLVLKMNSKIPRYWLIRIG